MKLGLTIALAVASLAVLAATESDSQWKISLCLDTTSKSFVLHEPVPVKVTWKNTTALDQFIRPVSPSFAVAQADGWRHMRLFETRSQEKGEDDYGAVRVGPQESFYCSYWLLLGAPVGSREWEFLFDGEGKWRVAWPSRKDTFVEFTVKAPREADKKAHALFTKEVAMVFHGEDTGPASAAKELTAMATDCPDSLYAPYAAVTLAERERRSGRTEIEHLDDQLEAAIRAHPSDLLGEVALDLAISRAASRGDYARAVELYKSLKANFPQSRFVEQKRALDGAPPVKVILKEPEQSKPAKRDPPEGAVPEARPGDSKSETQPPKIVGQAVSLGTPVGDACPQTHDIRHSRGHDGHAVGESGRHGTLVRFALGGRDWQEPISPQSV